MVRKSYRRFIEKNLAVVDKGNKLILQTGNEVQKYIERIQEYNCIEESEIGLHGKPKDLARYFKSI